MSNYCSIRTPIELMSEFLYQESIILKSHLLCEKYGGIADQYYTEIDDFFGPDFDWDFESIDEFTRIHGPRPDLERQLCERLIYVNRWYESPIFGALYPFYLSNLNYTGEQDRPEFCVYIGTRDDWCEKYNYKWPDYPFSDCRMISSYSACTLCACLGRIGEGACGACSGAGWLFRNGIEIPDPGRLIRTHPRNMPEDPRYTEACKRLSDESQDQFEAWWQERPKKTPHRKPGTQ